MGYRKYRSRETAMVFQPIGNSETPDTTAVTVIEKDSSDNVLRATGTSVPGTEAGFSKGCIFIKTDAGAGTEGFYRNIGTTAASSFEALDTITPTEIALAEGSVLVGNASSKAAAFDASGDTKVLVGNATTLTSVALSSDVTMANDGATTVAALDLETATVTNIVDTEIMIGTGAGTTNFAVMSGEITMTNAGVTTVGVLASGKIVRATNDTATGASFILDHVSTTPAALDVIGALIGRGQNDNTPQDIVDYGKIEFGIVDPANGAEVGGLAVSLQDGSGAYPTNAQFTVNGASGSIGVTCEDDGVEGAAITLTQVSASAAANDEIGYIKFVGNNDDTPVDLVEYAQIAGIITDVTNDAEWGQGRFKALNGTGSLGVAGGWSHDGSYGHLMAGDGSGQGEFTSLGDNDVVLATGNATTGSITITDGAAGAITIDPEGAGLINLDSPTVVTGKFTMDSIVAGDNFNIAAEGDAVGLALDDTNLIAMAVFPELAAAGAALTGGAVAYGFRNRFLVNLAQTANVSLYATQGQMRVKANLAAGVHAGLFGYFEQSGTVVLSSSGAFNTACNIGVETSSGLTLDAGVNLAGAVITSLIDSGGTLNGDLSGLMIRKETGKNDWDNGIVFNDCVSNALIQVTDTAAPVYMIDLDGASGANTTITSDSGSAATTWKARIKVKTDDGTDGWINVYSTSNEA